MSISPSNLPFRLLFLLAASFKGSYVCSAQVATRSNFFRLVNGRQQAVSCWDNPDTCLDRELNPWGGDTCCFQRVCRDTLRDPNNCGACGMSCGYGFECCGGRCIDLGNDPNHCGSCFEECPSPSKCLYAMCNYSG